jgi:aspartyl-tRNA(Asn)/glutamyl-tRNA(Gln) amidotransferase subunit A
VTGQGALTRATITALLDSLSRGETTSQALTRACLDAMEARADLNAFITVDAEGAMASAQAADRARRDGEGGALLGVPLAVKDNLVTQGLRTTCASRILEGFIPPYESTATARLRAAGAVILGKTNMDEFAMGSTTERGACGSGRNPGGADVRAGGSSGGSAAAVAARLCPGALGSDTGGSIRQPAACCGVVGLKPTYGRVSRFGLIALASSLDVVGPITRSVEDAARLLEVIAGHDPRDATSARLLSPSLVAATRLDPAGLRVGVAREHLNADLDPEVEAALRKAMTALSGLGCVLGEVSLPHSEHALATYHLLCAAEASSNLARYDGVRYGRRGSEPSTDLDAMYRRARTEGLGDEVKRRIMLGNFVLSAGYQDAYYMRAQRVRTLICRDFAQAFTRFDVLLTPTMPRTAPRLGALLYEEPLQMCLADVYTVSCNLAGLPGLSLPCGVASDGLPIGLQLLARPFDEARLLTVAAAYERARRDFPSPVGEPTHAEV